MSVVPHSGPNDTQLQNAYDEKHLAIASEVAALVQSVLVNVSYLDESRMKLFSAKSLMLLTTGSAA